MTVQNWLTGESPQQRQAEQGIPSLGQTAAGTTQGTAFQCPTDFVVFTTVAANSGCRVLGGVDQGTVNAGAPNGPCTVGDTMLIANHGANALLVYPQTGGTLQNGAVNAAISVPASKVVSLTYLGGGAWTAAIGN